MLPTQQIDQQLEQALHHSTTSRLHRLAQSKLGLWLVLAISFVESALPVPLVSDPFLVASILANRTKAWSIFITFTIASVLGGLAAFAMAAFFYETLTQFISPSLQSEIQSLISFGASDTLAATITGAVTPVPYTVTAWVVALAGGSVWVFIAGSILGRGFRYGVLAYCTYRFGETALVYARRSLAVTSALLLILIALYVFLKL